jgi:hypothetical protein
VSTSGLFEVNDHMIIGKVSFVSGNKSNTYNRAEVSFSNQEADYETDIRTYENSTYLTEDENEVLEIKHNSPGITDPDRAYDQARLLVQRSRKQNKIQFQGTAELQQLEASDVIKFTHQYVFNPTTASDYMFDETLFRVLQVKVNADMTVGISAVEHDNSIYDVEVYQIPAQQNINPKRFRPDNPPNNKIPYIGGSFTGIGKIIKVLRPVTPPTGDDLLVSPNLNYTLSVFDRPGIGTLGKGRVLIDYSGLSTFVDRFKTFITDGTTGNTTYVDVNHTSVSDLQITGDLDPGTYKLTMTMLGQGQELVVFENQLINVNPRGGGSSVTTASAAQGGFA